MKKKDIIQLIKRAIKENTFYGNREQPSQLSTGTKVVVPTDEYPFSKRPKRTATGMMEELELGVKYERPNGDTGYIMTGGSDDPRNWKFSGNSYLSVKDELKPLSTQPGKYDGAFDLGLGKGHHIDESNLNEEPVNEEPNLEIHDLLITMDKTKAGPEYKKALMALIAMAEKKSGKTINTKAEALSALDYTTPETFKKKQSMDEITPKNMKKPNTTTETTYAGKTAVDDMIKDPAYGALKGDAKIQLTKDLQQGKTATLENEIDDEGRMAKSEMYKMKRYVDKLSAMLDDGAQLPAWVQSKLTKASDYMSSVFHYLEYEALRGQDNLMEHVDKYKKRAVLMEGAMKKFFEMFDMGKTDEEIIQDYAHKGTQVPETFVGKARKQYESLKKMKLELEISEKEYKNSATKIVNNPATGEMDGSTTMETKQLTSSLFNEKLDPVGQEDDDVNNDNKVDKTDKYLKNKRKVVSKAINKNKK
jgi:hypothetical protein